MGWQSKIDQTFVINLEDRPERRKNVAAEMAKYGIKYTFIPGQYHENGEIGIKMTMAAIFDHAIKEEYSRILVFEDDAEVISESKNFPLYRCLEFHMVMQKIMNELPDDFLTLQLGINLLMPAERYSGSLLKVRAGYAAHAVIYSLEAMKLILPLLEEELAYDVIIAKHIQMPLNRSYCTYPMLVTQKPYKSDITTYEHWAGKPGVEKYLDVENKLIRFDKMMNDRYEQYTKNI